MSLRRPGDYFNQKKIEEEKRQELEAQKEARRKAIAEQQKRLRDPRKILGESAKGERLFPKRERPQPKRRVIKEEVVVEPPVDEITPLQESITFLNTELNSKADFADIVRVEEALEVYADDLLKRIDTLDIRHYDTEIDGLYNNLGALADAIDENLATLSKISGRDIEELRDEFAVMFKELQESLVAASEKTTADRAELIELHSQLAEIVADIPNQESRFNPQPIVENIEALRESLTISISESKASLDEKVDALDIRYYEDDLASIQKFAEEVKESIKYYDGDIESLNETIKKSEKKLSESLNRKVKTIQKTIKESAESVRADFPVVPEVKYYDEEVELINEQLGKIRSDIESLPEVKYYDKDVKKLAESIKQVDKKVSSIEIPDWSGAIAEIREEISNTKKLNEEFLSEVEDPIAPQNMDDFVTIEAFQKHYRTFLERIQIQLGSLGGGGAVRILDMDDVSMDLRMNPQNYNGQVLAIQHDNVTGITTFVPVTGGGSGGPGSQGATGATGPQGATGPRGATGVGEQGATGQQGPTGATGVGEQGATGLQGLQGATGVGEQGATGEAGLEGATGPIGATGVGEQGATGPIGATGVGEQGATGDVGPQGATGEQGATGPQGGTEIFLDKSPQLGGDLDGLNQNITNVNNISATGALFGGAQSLRAFNVFGTGFAGRISLQGGPGDNPGLEFTTNGNTTRNLFRYTEVGTGAELQVWTQPNGGAITKFFVIGSDGGFYINPPGSGALTANLGGFRNNNGTMQFQNSTGGWKDIDGAGATGATGVGEQGATGPIGATGVGEQGATGVIGPDGATGATGLQGEQGSTGATGIGATGATGIQGETGATGPAGGGFFVINAERNGTLQVNNEFAFGNGGNNDVTGAVITEDCLLRTISLGNSTNYSGPLRVIAVINGVEQSALFVEGTVGQNQASSAVLDFPINAGDKITFRCKVAGGGGSCVLTALFTTAGAIGPQGATGPRGPEGGPQGATGEIGPQGATGIQGIQGASGLQGIQGATGEIGPQGATGVGEQGATGLTGPVGTVILGTVPDEASLPGTGTIGQGYVVTAPNTEPANSVFVWDGSAYASIGPVQGPQGDKGDEGEQGATGLTGPVFAVDYIKCPLNQLTNINGNTAFTARAAINTTPTFQSGGFTVAAGGITVPTTGIYQVSSSCYMTSTVVRASVATQYGINGSPSGEIGAMGYIRSGNGHNESTVTLTTLLSLTAGDVVDIYFAQQAASGTVNLIAANSAITLMRIA